MRFKFTTVAWSGIWDRRQLYLSPHSHPLQQFVERGELIYFGLGGAPATNDFGASLGEKKVLIPLKSTISLCGGVARKFSLVKIPIFGHGGPMISYFPSVKFFLPKWAWLIWPRGKYATFGEPFTRKCLKIHTWDCAIWFIFETEILIRSYLSCPVSAQFIPEVSN